jgi:hypothetical protein
MGLLALPTGTYLVLTPLSGSSALQLTPYSARGLTQTFEPIKPSGQNWLRRDVNGILRSLVDTRFRKYKSTITCKDGETPCLDNAWIGLTCQVDCVFEFSYPTGGSPARPVVAGSSRTQGGITYYRPSIIMLVADIRVALPEWPALYDWQIDLEEE